ncbi:uncharacterized protein LOC135924485 [Gordionus sp. m RMFG-2023]|uniref:uncharacterized protein LOC135924485 n=1 Tax=Gordionus sp. m RMFG-2023 TaxID=3053472 RepID=UPI0031FDDB70
MTIMYIILETALTSKQSKSQEDDYHVLETDLTSKQSKSQEDDYHGIKALKRMSPKYSPSISDSDETGDLSENRKLQIASLNINGLNNKLAVLLRLLETEGVDLIGIQETHCPGNSRANFSVYKMFCSGTTSNSWAGIAFLTKKRLHKHIIKFVPVSERCGLLYLNTKFRPTIVVNFYAPPNRNMRKIFLDEMMNILNSLSNRYNVIILGDLNMKIGKDSEYISRGVIGQAAIQQSNDVENTFFCHRDINKYTFVRGRQISQIDFFISNIHSWFEDVKASTRVNISDHKMVIAVINIKTIWGYHNNSIPNLMAVNATSSNIIFPRNFINATRNGNVEVCWELFKKELAESYERLPNVNLATRKEWMSDETLEKIYQLRMTNSSNIDLWKDIKRLLRKDRRIFIAKRAADIDKDMKENRIYDAYRKLKYFCKPVAL